MAIDPKLVALVKKAAKTIEEEGYDCDRSFKFAKKLRKAFGIPEPKAKKDDAGSW